MKTTKFPLFRAAATALLLSVYLIPAVQDASAQLPGNSALWLQNPSSNFWNEGQNWSTGTAPNGTTDTANFHLSSVTNVSLLDNTSVGQIIFGTGPGGTSVVQQPGRAGSVSNLPLSNAYTIQTNGNNLDLYGQGIVNNSGQIQTFINGGEKTVQSSPGSSISIPPLDGTAITFHNSASAGDGVVIINQGVGSHVTFLDNSSGGTATIVNADSTSYIDISRLTSSGTSIGAVSGSGTIYLGSKNLAVGGNNTSTVFSGIIADGSPQVILTSLPSESARENAAVGGSLTKVGTGTLTLTGANTYTGNTTVNGGTLLIDGSIISPFTFVNPGGTLGGFGLIGGSVMNNGVVSPGNSPGTLTIKGSYSQGSSGALVIQLQSRSVFDRLVIGGSASLGGTLVVDPLSGFKLKRGQTFKFLTAGGGVNGSFDNLMAPTTGTILKFGVVYESNDVLLKAQAGSFSAAGLNLTHNEQTIADQLDNIVNDRRFSKLIDFLSTQPLADLPGDFDKIAAEEITSVFTIGVASDFLQSLNIQQHNSSLRSGSTGFNGTGFYVPGNGPSYSGSFGFAGPSGDDGKESKEMKTVAPEENRWGAFITGVGQWVGVSDDSNARGYDVETGGFTLGVDYKVCEHFAIGLMAGYVGTGVDLTDGGRVFVNGGKLGLYATAFDGGFYSDFAVTGGYSSYDTRRAALGGTARSDTDGGDLNVLVGGGYEWKTGGFSFGPTATFNYTYVGISGFTETGSLAPLQAGSQGQESIRSAFGFKASYELKAGGFAIKPEISAAWQHEYGDVAYALDSSFAAGGGAFSVNGPRLGRDSAVIGAGFSIQLSERASTYVYYDGELGRKNYNSQGVSGGFRLTF